MFLIKMYMNVVTKSLKPFVVLVVLPNNFVSRDRGRSQRLTHPDTKTKR